jgi:isocitrate dehydrogenase
VSSLGVASGLAWVLRVGYATGRTMTNVKLNPPPGDKIHIGANGELVVGDHPIIPFIEGDGTGPDIWRSSVRVFDAAVEKAYGGKRKIAWYEVLAGEKAFKLFNNWLPDETSRPSANTSSASRAR